MNENILEIENLTKVYPSFDQEVKVLDKVNLTVKNGEFLALMGPSGSGKTSLLNVISGLDSATSGKVRVDGTDIANMNEDELCDWRTRNISLVFQQYNLIPVLTAAENVELPLLLFRMSKEDRSRRVAAALELVGLSHRMRHYPRQMSGGEQQRTAIARALVTDPKVILADEPTGNLDAQAAASILDLLQRLNEKYGKTIVMVTHDPDAGSRAHRVIRLQKGSIGQEAGRIQ